MGMRTNRRLLVHPTDLPPELAQLFTSEDEEEDFMEFLAATADSDTATDVDTWSQAPGKNTRKGRRGTLSVYRILELTSSLATSHMDITDPMSPTSNVTDPMSPISIITESMSPTSNISYEPILPS